MLQKEREEEREREQAVGGEGQRPSNTSPEDMKPLYSSVPLLSLLSCALQKPVPLKQLVPESVALEVNLNVSLKYKIRTGHFALRQDDKRGLSLKDCEGSLD